MYMYMPYTCIITIVSIMQITLCQLVMEHLMKKKSFNQPQQQQWIKNESVLWMKNQRIVMKNWILTNNHQVNQFNLIKGSLKLLASTLYINFQETKSLHYLSASINQHCPIFLQFSILRTMLVKFKYLPCACTISYTCRTYLQRILIDYVMVHYKLIHVWMI